MNKSLFNRFLIFSFIAFVVTGFALGYLISYHIRNDMILNIEDMISVDLETHLKELNRIITLVMSLGLLVLYVLLMRIIYNASKTLVSQNQKLTEQKEALEQSYKMLNESYRNTITALSNAVDAKDPYTAGHSERVAEYSVQIAKKLGFDLNQLNTLEIAALLHDIGKIGIRDHILLKPGKLTDEEYSIIKSHPSIAASILNDINYLSMALPSILHHHERFDGKGYPEGLHGNEIPIGSRILAVADTYDAMTSDRPYRDGLSHKIAVDEIESLKAVQFDPEVVDAFLEINTNWQ